MTRRLLSFRGWLRAPLALVACAALAHGSPAGADEAPTTPAAKPDASSQPETLWELLVEKYDANHDGVIAKSEYTRGEAAFARCDTNGDGVLTSADGLGRPGPAGRPGQHAPRGPGQGAPPPQPQSPSRPPPPPGQEAPRCPQCGCALPPPPGPRGPGGPGGPDGSGGPPPKHRRPPPPQAPGSSPGGNG